MPSFTVPGISSGQNTNDLVRQLVEVEAKPIKRWEKENEHNKIQVRAWNELKNQAVNLQIKTKSLTSFTAPFSSKKITANEEGFISGDAGKGAKVARQEVEILQLATRHKVAGNKVKKDTEIPEGVFTVISKDKRSVVNFEGGDIDALAEKIKNVSYTIVKPNVTRVDSDNVVLSLSALLYGKDAELKFLDPNGVLGAAGLVGANEPEPDPTRTQISLAPQPPVAFQPERFTASNNPENAPVKSPEGTVIKPGTAFTFEINKVKIEKYASVDLSLIANTNGEGKLPEFIGFGVYYETKTGEKNKYQSLEFNNGYYSLPVYEFAKDQNITKIIVANTSDSDITFNGVYLTIPPEVKGALPNSIIIPAQDAIFKIDGIEITRSTNDNIKDAIEGTSINLLKPTQNPITLEVTADTNKAMSMVREFVEAYNSMIKYSRDISASNKDGKIDLSSPSDKQPELDISAEYWSNKSKSGILSGDATIIRLISSLRAAIGASYPSSTEPRYKVLSDIGITTGAPGSSWQEIQEGYLTINETVLQSALADNPESVRELFASDSNEDSKLDDGVGIALQEALKPYTQFTSGIVQTKIKLAETQIQENNRKIKNYETYLAGYEKKLKQRFQYMEQGIGKNKVISNYLNQSIKQLKANNIDPNDK
ncbi:MAG: flagellar filament capping protein FliD [Leptospiraceae bacterium]|nr:flagellar filament capping protein FliD [Leptospiraceae bacterium]